jgi:tRNA-Thr(GGU) m(6)t(6)A37 methyltransferase TsaA
MSNEERPGEIRAARDPAAEPGDAKLVFIGRALTPWKMRDDCPRSLREARKRGEGAELAIDATWRDGLRDLRVGDGILLLTWLDRARRDLLVQAPRHRSGPAGVFSLRSPVRPNPIGVHVVRVTACDPAAGRIAVDALDVLDGTPVLDIKPWLSSTDALPEPDAAQPHS